MHGYAGLKRLPLYYFCSWHGSGLLEKIRMGSRQGTAPSERDFGEIIGIPAQGARAGTQQGRSVNPCAVCAEEGEGLLPPRSGTEMDVPPLLCVSSDWQGAVLAFSSLVLRLFVLLF